MVKVIYIHIYIYIVMDIDIDIVPYTPCSESKKKYTAWHGEAGRWHIIGPSQDED
jgi:hypothetical protein